ncbi:MAG: YceI family protein [Planctomycetaceae bacterium]|nr:YceI family protein [Planctomycetaceae bacterium]
MSKLEGTIMLRTGPITPLTRIAFVAAICLSLSHALCAQQGGVKPPAPAKDSIDTKTSRVYVFVGKTGFGHEHAVLGLVKSGEIHLGNTQNAGSIVFDMSTFTADTAEARRAIGLGGSTDASTAREVTQNMLGGYVLNVRQFPTSTFTINSALPTGKQSQAGHPLYELKGNWQLHGVTQPLALQVEAVDVKGQTHLRGRFAMLQTHFGIKPFTKALGAVGVTDRLVINGNIVINK